MSIAAIAVLSVTGHLESLELKSYDFLMAVVRGPLPPPDDIVIVAIDESSIKEFSNDFPWPWPRRVHAELIRQLAAAGAGAIVFDVVFDLPTNPEDDGALAEAIHAGRIPVVLAATIAVVEDQQVRTQQRLLPRPEFAAAGGLVGYATIHADSDGALRRAPVEVGAATSLSALASAARGRRIDRRDLPLVTSDEGNAEFLINFAGPSRTIRTVSYYQAIEADTALPRGLLAGKTVFIGRSLTLQDLAQGAGTEDLYRTPFDLQLPGVEVHANAFNTLTRGLFIRRASGAATWLFIVALGVIMSAIVLAPIRLRLRVLIAFGLIAMIPIVTGLLFVYARYWLYTVQPAAIAVSVFGLNTLYQYRASERERAYVRKALKGYVSKQVLQRLLENPAALDLGGVQVEATVVFCDIVGFSSVAERMSPREVAALLNDFFTRLGDAVMHEDGLVDKYIGDAIMAVWGAPLPEPRHAARACAASLVMRHAVAAMGGVVRARIGINTGLMMAGNLGHRDRMQYTVIGDAVNLASRLEGTNKLYGTGILASESTVEQAKGEYRFRRVDRIRVVGKQEPVVIFELLGARAGAAASPQTDARFRDFDAILVAYDRGDWTGAGALIATYRATHGGTDPVVDLYDERCRRFAITPPPADWDGVYTFTSK